MRKADFVYRSSGEIDLLQLIGRGGRKCDNKPLLMTRIQFVLQFLSREVLIFGERISIENII